MHRSTLISLLLGSCGCVVTTVETPTEIPPELRQVIDNPVEFTETDHPLADTELGETRDDITSIVGCWGRAGRDLDEGRAADVALLSEVLKIEPDGTMWTYEFFRYAPGSELSEFNNGNNFLKLVKADYRVLNPKTIDFRTRGEEAGEILLAHVTPDWQIVPLGDIANLVASTFSIHNSWEIGITTQGDWLRTDDGFIGSPPDGSNYRYWKRLSCQVGPVFTQRPVIITSQAWRDWVATPSVTD